MGNLFTSNSYEYLKQLQYNIHLKADQGKRNVIETTNWIRALFILGFFSSNFKRFLIYFVFL